MTAKHRRKAGWILFFLGVISLSAESKEKKYFEFLYLDANVGLSSGGHNALKFEDTVYHFEHHADGIFRLGRAEWPDFHRNRTVLENRSIHSAVVEVSADTYRILQEQLNTYQIVQNKQLDLLQDVRNDIYLLEILTGISKERVFLPGVGLFERKEGEGTGPNIKEIIDSRLGNDFLKRRIQEEREAIGSLLPLESPHLFDAPLSENAYPRSGVFFSSVYKEKVQFVEALEILEQNSGLLPASIVRPPLRASDSACDPQHPVSFVAGANDPFLLSEREREILSEYKDRQVGIIVRLLQSARPDPGFAILVAYARYQVLLNTLESNRFQFLDVYPDTHFRVPVETFCEFKEKVPSMMQDFLSNFQKERETAFKRALLYEQSYNRLETTVAKYSELARGLQGEEVRISFQSMYPAKKGAIDPIPVGGPQKDQFLALARSYESEREYLSALHKLYSYDLLDRNCSTELFRNLNLALENDRERIATELGGYIDPDEDLTFIPNIALVRAEERYRTVETREFLSYRKARLRKMYRKETNAKAYLREANTISSTIYEPNDQDSWFVFFTDDEIAPRPLYGIVNFAAGFVQTVVGIARSPWDEGRSLSRGLRGMAFSVPELVFVNIRKGSFLYVPNSLVKEEVIVRERHPEN